MQAKSSPKTAAPVIEPFAEPTSQTVEPIQAISDLASVDNKPPTAAQSLPGLTGTPINQPDASATPLIVKTPEQKLAAELEQKLEKKAPTSNNKPSNSLKSLQSRTNGNSQAPKQANGTLDPERLPDTVARKTKAEND